MESCDQQKRPSVIEKKVYHAKWDSVSAHLASIDLEADTLVDLFDKVFRCGFQLGREAKVNALPKFKLYSEDRKIQEIEW